MPGLAMAAAAALRAAQSRARRTFASTVDFQKQTSNRFNVCAEQSSAFLSLLAHVLARPGSEPNFCRCPYSPHTLAELICGSGCAALARLRMIQYIDDVDSLGAEACTPSSGAHREQATHLEAGARTTRFGVTSLPVPQSEMCESRPDRRLAFAC